MPLPSGTNLANYGVYCPRDISLACFDSAGKMEEPGRRPGPLCADDWQLGSRAVRALLSAVRKRDLPVVTELLAAAVTGDRSIAECHS